MDSEVENERLRLLEDAREGMEPDWADSFRPGSFGCHELLDRTSTVGGAVDEMLVSHPSCLLNPEWFALPERAMSALHELYQKVGAVHLGETPDIQANQPTTRSRD